MEDEGDDSVGFEVGSDTSNDGGTMSRLFGTPMVGGAATVECELANKSSLADRRVLVDAMGDMAGGVGGYEWTLLLLLLEALLSE
jgi:hypothetical protein